MSEFVERLISMEISLNVRATVTHISPTVTHIYPHLEVITLEMDSDRPTELTIRSHPSLLLNKLDIYSPVGSTLSRSARLEAKPRPGYNYRIIDMAD